MRPWFLLSLLVLVPICQGHIWDALQESVDSVVNSIGGSSANAEPLDSNDPLSVQKRAIAEVRFDNIWKLSGKSNAILDQRIYLKLFTVQK